MKQVYLEKIFNEFRKEFNIFDNYTNFKKYSDLFWKWLVHKRKAASEYVKLIDYLQTGEVEQNLPIAEIGKGVYDTVATEMKSNTNHTPIIISKYADTFDENVDLEIYNGEIATFDDELIIKYPTVKGGEETEKPTIDDIGTFMLQYPYSVNELYPLYKLIESDKSLFIGTYGLHCDAMRRDNLNKIYELYKSLADIDFREVNFYSETKDDMYLSAVKVYDKPLTRKRER